MLLVFLLLLFGAQGRIMAQKTFGNIPDLHVEGKWFVDENGNKVNLHGVMDTPSNYFNGGRWDLAGGYSSSSAPTNCINYFKKLLDGVCNPELGTYCNLFRLHLDPCWTNNNSVKASGFKLLRTEGGWNEFWQDPNGQEVNGEGCIAHFDKNRLKTYLSSLYFKIAKEALNRGMYVIMRPPGVFPRDVYVGDYYNEYLMTVWDIVSQNDSIKKYSGQIMIELGNEPINMKGANNQNSASAMHDFFQPIVDKIRANGFTGIILVPGTGYQSNYKEYASYPITGYNIGYAVHVYSGWYGQSDSNANGNTFINNFKNQVPVVQTNPIVVTEIDWSPENKSGVVDHYNEFGQPVYKNYGTWATGSTSKWGKAWKAVHDHFGNIGMTLTHPSDFIDIDKWTTKNYNLAYSTWKANKSRVLEPAFLDAMKANGYKDAYEASSGACFEWYKEWSDINRPYMAYTRKYSADLGFGKYKNPILNADFPDPDVVRVGDTFYMVSTTMFHFPGATILKSKDLVNWEYCANPLKQIANTDNYNLLNDRNHYAQGQWAASLSYSKGKFYLYFISYGKNGEDEGKNIMLTTTNPEGKWDMQYWPEHYYDSGWLFDDGPNGDGNVYVACGIGTIFVNKLDGKTLKKISDKVVIKDYTIKGQKCDGIEGSHMYHIGDYYYIYATTGGYFRGQQIFRSKDPMGPYEECPWMVFENQGIHQGALVDTPTGEWWTILFKDAGAIGRVPYLEPVTWEDGWPRVGIKSGSSWVDVTKDNKAYTKPNVGKTYPRTYLPTNDTFTDPELGMQWGWNHNPDNNAWSLMENPGNLRLHTSGITKKGLLQARNSLTQRIWSYVPEGTTSSRVWNSYGTIKMNISNMQNGDVAGIAVFQDPYSLIGVKQIDGKRYLYSELTYVTPQDGTNESKLGDEITSDVIYLRAMVNFGTNKAKFYYSLDNQTYTQFGVEMDMRFILSVFVGQRFYIFNYATEQNGGFVDVDWFTTEPVYDESYFFGEGVLHTYTKEELTMASLSLSKTSYKVPTGATSVVDIICISEAGNRTNVAANCVYDIANPEVAVMVGNAIQGIEAGSTEITATYTDIYGNSKSVTFSVTVPDDYTMKSLVIGKKEYSIISKGIFDLTINCTAVSGTVTNVADKCVYEISNEDVISIKNGRITAKNNGKTDVTATYTDKRGNTAEVQFSITVTPFPLTTESFDPSIYENGKLTVTSGVVSLTTGTYGFGGWRYGTPLDISEYKYLVVRLSRKASCSPSFRIFDTDDYWGSPYIIDIKGDNKEAVIDLHNMVNEKGKKVNPANIRIAGFWSYGGSPIYIKEVFLSDDGVNPTDIESILYSSEPVLPKEGIYNLNGQRLNTPQKGINIINGKKVFIK